jgi:RNA polymerase subunit RPABC4/transcription elongation factor Spt4
MTEHNSSPFMNELRIIPTGWKIAALLSFFCFEFAFGQIMPRIVHHHGLPPQPWWTLIAVVGSLFIALTVALIGYIYADAKRRGMNAILWVVLVILIPKMIGFIAYFLLRKPILHGCPQCGAPVRSDFHFCPQCHYALSPVCNRCGRPIGAGYAFCPYCGQGVGVPMQPAAPNPA